MLPKRDDAPKKDEQADMGSKEPKVRVAKVEPVEAAAEAKTATVKQVQAVDKPAAEQAATETMIKPKLATASTMLAKVTADRNLKRTAIRVGLVLVVLVVVVVVAFGVLIYGYKSENSIVKAVASVVPYPIQQVNGRFVTYKDFLFEVDANKRAYQNNAKLNNQPAVDFASADGKKLVTQIKQHSMDKLESDALVVQLAAAKKVRVKDKEVNDLVNQLYTRYGGKDTLLKTLNQIYGWNLTDLRKVVRKQLLAKDLQEKVTSDPAVDATAKAKAQDVLKKIKDNGDFAALAKQYSQSSDASSGGDLGFFTKGQLPDNLQAAAEALQPGQVSDVVKTQYGYEIIKVVEKKDDGSIRGLHILIKTVDFDEYFQGELKKAKVHTYLKV